MTTAQDVGKVVSLTHRPPLPPWNTPGTQEQLYRRESETWHHQTVKNNHRPKLFSVHGQNICTTRRFSHGAPTSSMLSEFHLQHLEKFQYLWPIIKLQCYRLLQVRRRRQWINVRRSWYYVTYSSAQLINTAMLSTQQSKEVYTSSWVIAYLLAVTISYFAHCNPIRYLQCLKRRLTTVQLCPIHLCTSK